VVFLIRWLKVFIEQSVHSKGIDSQIFLARLMKLFLPILFLLRSVKPILPGNLKKRTGEMIEIFFLFRI